MAVSYNGWSASTDNRDFGGLDNRAVAGVHMAPGVRAGDVATVLFYVAEQFHHRVEALVPGWCWGYYYRQNRNAANLSCHSSATAIDLNAPRHPNGKRGTFTKAQVAEIRAIQFEVQKVVRWGGDFTGTPDEMHFEIVASPATVGLVASQLTRKVAGPLPALPTKPVKPPTPRHVLEDDAMYISCEARNFTGLLSGGILTGLGGSEVTSASTNIAAGALRQWVTPQTLDELIRKSQRIVRDQ